MKPSTFIQGIERHVSVPSNPNRALWEQGDFTEIAVFMRQSGEAVVQGIGIEPPVRVLDLGCGDGTTAIPLARLGAEVVGIDIARNLVEAGNRLAAEAGLTRLKSQEGDACSLAGVADSSFDLVISFFGAMFAPKPFDVAKEMVRVTKHGGRIVMGNWIPNDPTFVSQVLKISSAFTPPPPEGVISPMTWGVESNIIERFDHAGVPKENISMARDTYYFASPEKIPTELVEELEQVYGPTMTQSKRPRKMERRRNYTNGFWNCRTRRTKVRMPVRLYPPLSCASLFPSNEPMKTLTLIFVLAISARGQDAISLKEVVRQSMARSRVIEASSAAIDAASARVTEAKSGWLPKVTYSESWTRSDNPVFVFSSVLTQRQFSESNFDVGDLNRPGLPQ